MDGGYKVLSLDYRNVNSGSSSGCDRSSSSRDWRGPDWYRMKMPAGVKIPEHVVDEEHCGTHATGWLRGTHPMTPHTTVSRTVCFNWSSNSCWKQIDIQIRNCSGFYVYHLPATPSCSLRYCSVND